MRDVTIYHNPRCSKSRQTLELLKQHGLDPKVVEYLKTPPEPEVLKQIIERLELRPADLMRTKESLYKELNLTAQQLTDDELIEVMCKHPKLIERPIVLCNDKARIGRPPEAVLELL